LVDERFKDVFRNTDFKIDPNHIQSDTFDNKDEIEDIEKKDNGKSKDENIDNELNQDNDNDKSNHKKFKK